MDSVKRANIELVRKSVLNGVRASADELKAAMASRNGLSKLNDAAGKDIVGVYREWLAKGVSTEWAHINYHSIEIAAIADAHRKKSF